MRFSDRVVQVSVPRVSVRTAMTGQPEAEHWAGERRTPGSDALYRICMDTYFVCVHMRFQRQ